VLETVSDTERIAPEWNALAERAGSPIGMHSWAVAAAESIGADRPLSIVTLHDEQGLAALAPLARRPGVRSRLELIGLHEIYEPTDFLYRDPSSLGRLAGALDHLGAPLFLWRLPAESPTANVLRTAIGRRATIVQSAGGCPYIDLDDSWADPESHFSSRRRSDFRRARRRAEALGTVDTEVRSPGPDEAIPLFEEAVAVEAASWKGEGGTALARSPAKLAFYRAWVVAAAREGVLRVCFLRIDGKAAAMQLAAESGGRFWLLKIGYDEQFARASPGQLLMLDTLRDAAGRGLRSYEFLGTVAPWTEVWTDRVRECVSVRAYPAGWRSVPVALADGFSAARAAARHRRS
jgi:CelD/BcsL family acetyltransferase involved in cellulose biosynthesis